MTQPLFLHCRNCMTALPVSVSAQEWSRLSVSINTEGLLTVACHRCGMDVARFTLASPPKVTCELCEKGVEHQH